MTIVAAPKEYIVANIEQVRLVNCLEGWTAKFAIRHRFVSTAGVAPATILPLILAAALLLPISTLYFHHVFLHVSSSRLCACRHFFLTVALSFDWYVFALLLIEVCSLAWTSLLWIIHVFVIASELEKATLLLCHIFHSSHFFLF